MSPEEEKEFIRQCCRQINRPLAQRERYGFVKARRGTPLNKAFSSLEDYRDWQAQHYPEYFGYRSNAGDL